VGTGIELITLDAPVIRDVNVNIIRRMISMIKITMT
jgi:hypothetical protein